MQRMLLKFFFYVCAGLAAEKLEWGNSEQISQILQKYSRGFDLILGADIYILNCYSFAFIIKKVGIYSGIPQVDQKNENN